MITHIFTVIEPLQIFPRREKEKKRHAHNYLHQDGESKGGQIFQNSMGGEGEGGKLSESNARKGDSFAREYQRNSSFLCGLTFICEWNVVSLISS